jgi:hypothetical protein
MKPGLSLSREEKKKLKMSDNKVLRTFKPMKTYSNSPILNNVHQDKALRK